MVKRNRINFMERYDQNSFYYSITEELWCWKQTSTGKIFKAKTKSELSSIKEKQFIGSGNYEREYNLGDGLVSTEEFGKITGVGTKQYISLLLKRGTTPSSNYDKTKGGDGVHKPEGRRKKGVHFIECLNKSKISFDRVTNQYNTKVWVFKNITQDKIKIFKNHWINK